MYTVKWAVLQYVVVRPLVSITGIICEAFNVLCDSAGFSLNAVHFANIYLEIIDFFSITCVSFLPRSAFCRMLIRSVFLSHIVSPYTAS